MNTFRLIPSMILLVALPVSSTSAQQRAKLGENAALRYWSAFAEMQDSAITDQQAKELNLILDGTAPYEDLKYKDLVEKNRPALETMARAAALPNCDWGVDYELGAEAPVDYVRKALALGRLNVLYAFHLLIAGDKDGAVRTLATGLRFSHDVANGGTLFATLAAKSLLAAHVRAIAFALHVVGLSSAQRLVLQKALAPLGPRGLDWQSALKRELEISHGLDSQASAALERIISSYLAVLNNPSTLPELQQMIVSAPAPLPDIIPNPKRVLEEQQDLTNQLLRMRSLLQ
ncbi:MAG: hypothetical protein DMG24_10720 [Acidobacteria bacterium]|nr:MAG: hypothetical protein DMG24_10720 [Acidobacteriota bacterium]